MHFMLFRGLFIHSNQQPLPQFRSPEGHTQQLDEAASVSQLKYAATTRRLVSSREGGDLAAMASLLGFARKTSDWM